MSDRPATVAVIGGGVIGLATALTLQTRGLAVTLIDRDAPGQACSAGNAGVIAASHVLPLSSLDHIVGAPRMLLDPLGPLAIRLRDLPATAPWLASFALNALPDRQRRTIAGLKRLNGGALAAWRRLLDVAGAPALLIERGLLDIVPPGDRRAARSLARYGNQLAAEGIALDRLGAGEVAELEPLLAGRAGAGLFHRELGQVADPLAVSAALLAAFTGRGGQVRRVAVGAITPAADGVAIFGDSEGLRADHVIVTAGHRSAELLRPLGLRVPIGVERGYHVTYATLAERPSRPVTFHRENFIATPIGAGLRLAGTVEIARPDAPPDWRRADQLPRLARRYLPQIDAAEGTRWMGRRPSFADSLPAIGRAGPRLCYAFGHQHLGLTQAAITAEIVAAMLPGGGPGPYGLSLDRFA